MRQPRHLRFRSFESEMLENRVDERNLLQLRARADALLQEMKLAQMSLPCAFGEGIENDRWPQVRFFSGRPKAPLKNVPPPQLRDQRRGGAAAGLRERNFARRGNLLWRKQIAIGRSELSQKKSEERKSHQSEFAARYC